MNELTLQQQEELMASAREATAHAYAPYSGFRVGAALLTEEGKVYQGCNIENASYGATNCAERTALFTAVYAGERHFKAIAIACSGQEPPFPCGICRQALSEFCGEELTVLCTSADGKTVITTLGQLLPHSFGRKDLD